MSNADLHTLTGAYALHALAEDEEQAFERHLTDCPACEQEVREFAATAERLALATTVTPPAAMKTEVLRRIATVRQDAPQTGSPKRLVRPLGRGGRPARFVLAACVAAAAAFGGVAVWQHQEADRAQQQAQAAQEQARDVARVLAAPDAKSRTDALMDGASGTVVVSRSLDQAVFVAADMPKPPEGKVYQLWFNDDGSMRSAGLMNSARSTDAVTLDGAVDRASGMGITVEPAGGSPQPTSDPVALMDFPA